MPVTVCVSGYFDPLHVGHIEYLRMAKDLGSTLIVIVNNDKQAILKKGRSFMPANERVQIMQSLRLVDQVYLSFDEDRTVCKTLEMIHPDIFCNGGDQNNNIIPEIAVCNQLNIKLIDGLGSKIQSSSWLISDAKPGGSKVT
jgi:cytidyltransferase-like protein